MTGTLRDLGTAPFEIAPVGDPPAGAPADRWVVLVHDDGRPASALAPGTSLADGRLPGILVAAADLSQATAFASDAFGALTDFSALVLTEPSTTGPSATDPSTTVPSTTGPSAEPGAGQSGRPGIAGVVTGQMVLQALQRGTTRITGPVLPGAPSIPLISRSCGYTEDGTMCGTMMSFQARPYPMPGCDNDRGLTAHQFAW